MYTDSTKFFKIIGQNVADLHELHLRGISLNNKTNFRNHIQYVRQLKYLKDSITFKRSFIHFNIIEYISQLKSTIIECITAIHILDSVHCNGLYIHQLAQLLPNLKYFSLSNTNGTDCSTTGFIKKLLQHANQLSTIKIPPPCCNFQNIENILSMKIIMIQF